MATRDVFSADELAQLRGFPEIGRAELIRFFMHTPADEEFVRRFRDKRNVLGAAVQLCTLPWLGFVPEDVPSAPDAAVARLSERLGIPVGELRGYGARAQTRSDHLGDVVAYLGWHQVDGPRWKDLEEFLFAVKGEAAKVLHAEALGTQALLLGRRTDEFFAARWASRSGEWADRLNSLPKYVVSSTLHGLLQNHGVSGCGPLPGLTGSVHGEGVPSGGPGSAVSASAGYAGVAAG